MRKINLLMEIGTVLICIVIFIYFDFTWWIPVAIYLTFWLIWVIFVGGIAVWKAYIKHKYKEWFKTPK